MKNNNDYNYYEKVIKEFEDNKNKPWRERTHTCKWCGREIYINIEPCFFFNLLSVPNFVCDDKKCIVPLSNHSIVPNWAGVSKPKIDEPIFTVDGE